MAEKKSTKGKATQKKRAVKKVEGTKPVSDVQPAVEEKQVAKWDMPGLFSAVVPLIGTAILFMIGWAYQANWYGFFGVSMSQVSISPQDVFIQSIPGVVTIASCLSAAIMSYIFFFSLIELIRQFKLRREVEEYPTVHSKVPLVGYSTNDWIAILIITEILLLIFLYLIYLPLVGERIGDFNKLSTLYEIIYIPFLVLTILAVGLVTTFLYSIIFILGWLIYLTYRIIRSWFLPNKKIYIDNPSQFKVPQPSLVISAMIFLIVLTSLALSAIYGINDASNGIHAGTWHIQKVKVISSKSNPLQKLGGSYCYTDYCESSPFGLIGENDKSYILISWDKVGNKYFKYNSGIILLPRGDDITLVPYNFGE